MCTDGDGMCRCAVTTDGRAVRVARVSLEEDAIPEREGSAGHGIDLDAARLTVSAVDAVNVVALYQRDDERFYVPGRQVGVSVFGLEGGPDGV